MKASINKKFKYIYDHYFKPEILLLVLGIPFGFLCAILTPPLYVPDEQAHYWRAFQISEGRLVVPQDLGKTPGDNLPLSIVELFETVKTYQFQGELRKDLNLSDVMDYYDVPLDKDRRGFVGMINTASYSPVPYIPQSIGIFIGRVSNFSPVGVLQLGRITNMIICLFLIYLAIKITPVLKWSFMLLGLMPMALVQLASVSADGFTIALAFLLIALIFRVAFDDRSSMTKKWLISAVIVGILLGLAKQAYFPLIGLVVLIPTSKFGVFWKRIVFCILFVAITILPSMTWNNLFVKEAYTESDKARIATRIEYVKTHPDGAAFTLANDIYLDNGGYYFESTIGQLGWLNLHLPFLFVLLPYAFLLIITALFEHSKIHISFWAKLLCSAIVAANVLFISSAMYILWTRGLLSFVNGVQGRYFIPILPLLLLILLNKSFVFKPKVKYPKLYFTAVVVTMLLLTVNQVLFYFYMKI